MIKGTECICQTVSHLQVLFNFKVISGSSEILDFTDTI